MQSLPLWKSHFSIGKSILTLAKAGETDNSCPDSIFDLAESAGLKEIILVEDSISGFLEAFTNSKKSKKKLIFGLRLSVVENMEEKTEQSLDKVCKYVIFAKDTIGYETLIKVSSLAAKNGFYYEPKIDFKNLKDVWSEHLQLAVPFYDSFIHKNVLECGACVPDFSFTTPVFFMEDNDVPFDEILSTQVTDFCSKNKFESVKTKSIYYNLNKDFITYLTFRCINARTSLERPELPHMCSQEFSFESWKKQNQISNLTPN
jgi:DNA polymerase III alpha subunit